MTNPIIGLTLFFAIAAQAPAVEQAKDRRHLREDRRDRARIIHIAQDWNQAVAKRDPAGEQAADARLAVWLAEELGESTVEAGQARREAGKSNVERNQSRREAIGSGTPDDRHDLRDDRRDLRDDRRDAAVATADAAQTRAIALQLRTMQPSFAARSATPAQYATKRELIGKLVASAQREVNRDRREKGEDRRERREDRRERREDRR